jgi:hypothetical protein
MLSYVASFSFGTWGPFVLKEYRIVLVCEFIFNRERERAIRGLDCKIAICSVLIVYGFE